jgi:hypothetical protein
MSKPPRPGKTTLSIVTVTNQDFERFQRTAITVCGCFEISIEWVVVVPLEDLPTRKYLKTLSHIPNLIIADDLGVGIYEAMNIGLGSAKGKYVCFLNSGDLVNNSESLQELIVFLTTMQHKLVIVDVDIPWRNPQQISIENFVNFTHFKSGSFISHQSVIMQRQFLLDLSGFNSKFRVAADTDLIVRASRKSQPGLFRRKVFYVEKPRFASHRNRRGRVEVLVIAFTRSEGLDKVKTSFRLIAREFQSAFRKISGN